MPFLSSLLSFFESVCLDQSEELYILVKACLQRFLVFQRQQVNQRKVSRIQFDAIAHATSVAEKVHVKKSHDLCGPGVTVA